MGVLREFMVRKGSIKYKGVLKTILQLFVEGFHQSLSRTMGEHLEAADEEKTNSKLKYWECEQDSKLLCHNNHAERGFAVVKDLLQKLPMMELANVRHIAHARLSGLFKPMPHSDLQYEWGLLPNLL